MPDPQVTETDQGGKESLGWRAALPDEFKEHGWVKTFSKPGDFVKDAIAVKTDRDSLKTKLDNSIPKLLADASDQEKDVYYLSIGRPEKAEQYEFPDFNGRKNDPEFVKAASEQFFKTGVPKNMVTDIVNWYNGYMDLVEKKIQEKYTKERSDADAKLKADLGDKYDASIQLLTRLWEKHVGKDMPFNQWLNRPRKEGELLGNDPFLIRYMLEVAKLTGEDISPPGSPPRGKPKEGKPGEFLTYDKSPPPPNK
jgi:hypothetical protein